MQVMWVKENILRKTLQIHLELELNLKLWGECGY